MTATPVGRNQRRYMYVKVKLDILTGHVTSCLLARDSDAPPLGRNQTQTSPQYHTKN
jgi:hypothetical protein